MPNCKLVDCSVVNDGRCLEGHNGDCPNLEPDSTEAPSITVQPAVSEFSKYSTPREPLYSGLPLEIDEAKSFCQRGPAIVVALAGMQESGKTSLIARVHQQFQAGPVGEYAFVGSRTLYRFEELNWLATVESGASTPEMDRSPRRYDNAFLHFTIQGNDGNHVDLLINDISGDTYPDAITEESICRGLLGVARADHVALVVDGAAIADHGRRHDHCAKVKNFVQRLLQTGQVDGRTILHLVISKLDELSRPEQRAENFEAVDRLEAEFNARFGSRVAKVYCWRIAARPLDGSMPTEGIITELFGTWARTSLRNSIVTRGATFSMGANDRDFARFPDANAG